MRRMTMSEFVNKCKVDEYKKLTLQELEDKKDSLILKLRILWINYTQDHIAMLECTGIDDEGDVVELDEYRTLYDKCAKDIADICSVRDDLDILKEVLNDVKSNGG